jgi:hypothetical protein
MPDTTTRPWFCPRDGCPAPERHHDTRRGYQLGCRSGQATYRHTSYSKKLEAGVHVPQFVPITGTARRVRALMAYGWRSADIAEVLGWAVPHKANGRVSAHSHVVALAYEEQRQVSRELAEKIVKVYAELGDRPGPSHRNRLLYQRKGWAIPSEWDDDSLDDPDAQPAGGALPPVTERAHRAAQLVAQGMLQRDAAELLGISRPTLQRDLQVWRRAQAGTSRSAGFDEYAIESVLSPLGSMTFDDCTSVEQDAIVMRLWRDYLGQGYEKPGREVAKRLDIDHRIVERVRERSMKRAARERQEEK